MRFRIIGALVAILVTTASVVSAQQVAQARKLGRLLQVIESGSYNPVQDADLVDTRTWDYIKTNEQGAVNLEFTYRQGWQKFMLRKLGYKPVEFEYFAIGADAPDTLVTVVMERVPTTLPEVLVKDARRYYSSSILQEFEDRRVRGIGKFLGPEDLRAYEAKGDIYLETVLKKIGATTRKTVGLSGNCIGAQLFLDGVPVRTLPTKNPELRDYDAVEFYKGPATTPARFSSMGSTCGVLVLWSRTR